MIFFVIKYLFNNRSLRAFPITVSISAIKILRCGRRVCQRRSGNTRSACRGTIIRIPPAVRMFKHYARQSAAITERISSDARYIISDRYARQSAAITERIISDTLYAVGDRYTRQPVAAIERRAPDARHAVSDRYARQSAAIIK